VLELSRIEGEAFIEIYCKDGERRVNIRVVEPNRYFEKILINRSVEDGLEIVSRICGFCGTSHTYAYVKSFEKNLEIPEEVEEFRKIVLLGERVKSHILHSCFLILPDLLGLKSFNDVVINYPQITVSCINLFEYINSF